MAQKSPLPVRNGVNATRLKVPLTGHWGTVHQYVLEVFGHIDPAGISDRFHRGEVVDSAGAPLTVQSPLGTAEFIWYYRSLPEETPLPVTERVLFEDEHLLVVDKPHFLPTTPAGRYVQESLLVRLRHRLGLPDLVPIHRLDRGTAGVVLFAKNPQTRGAYQLLFEKRRVAKTYQCVSLISGRPEAVAARFPLTVRNRIEKTKGVLRSRLVAYAPEASGLKAGAAAPGRKASGVSPPPEPTEANSSSRIELLEQGQNRSGRGVGLFRLTPHTGKTHQLRLHMALLGLGILHDRFYPKLWDDAPDDFDAPLQLLAHSLSFTDPLSGTPRHFASERRLVEAPEDPGLRA